MDVKVRFRFNATTGEVEIFEVTHEGPQESGPAHDRNHDRIAADVGRVVDRRPIVREVAPGGGPSAGRDKAIEPEEQEREKERERRRDTLKGTSQGS